MKNALYFLLLFFVLQSCQKDGGYYQHKLEPVVFKGSIYDYLRKHPGVFDSLLLVVDRLGKQVYLQDSNVTLFATTNQSYQLAIDNLNNAKRASDKQLEYLATVNEAHLDTMLAQYIIRGRYMTNDLVYQDGLDLQDIQYGLPMHAKLSRTTSSGFVGGGPFVIDFSDTKYSKFYRDWVTTSSASVNIQTDNGVIHIINNDHVFGFNDFTRRFTFIPPPVNLFLLYGGIHSVSVENPSGPNSVEASKYLFDNNPETKFYTTPIGASFYMTWEFPQSVVANSYTMTSANNLPDRDPQEWVIMASNTGNTGDWVTLDSKISQLFPNRFETRVFRFDNKLAYKYYRLHVITLKSGTAFQMADWTMNYEEK